MTAAAPGPPAVRWREAAGLHVVEVVSPGADPDAPMPTVVAVHGRGDRPHVPEGPFYGLRAPLRYLAPRAPAPLGEGFSWFPVRVGDGRDDTLARAVGERCAQLAAALGALVPAGSPPPLVTGFSQGGLVTLGLALLAPETVRAAFPSAAWLPEALVDAALARGAGFPPIRGQHGAEDAAVPPGPAQALYARLAAAGLDAALSVHAGVGHEASPAMHAEKARWLAQALGPVRP